MTNIQPSCSNIGTDKRSLFSVAELEEGISSLLLLLLPMEVQDGEVDVIEKFGVVLYTSTTRKENNDLFVEVALEE